MNAEDLRYFLAVRQAGSIKGGARTLKVDHSTVSRRLATLEEALGVKLFERTTEGLVETEVARAIGPLAEKIELMTQELEDAAKAVSSEATAPVRIAVSPMFADHFLMTRTPDLLRRLPGIPLDILADISRVNMLRREADIAVRQHPEGKPPAEPSALALKIGSVGFAAFASREYLARHGSPPEPIRSLEGHRMISTGKWGPGDSWNARLETPAEYVLSVYPFSSAIGAAAAGVGIAVLPCIAGAADPRLVRLTDVVQSYDNWIVTNESVRDNPRVRAVKDALVAMIREAAAELSGATRADASDASRSRIP